MSSRHSVPYATVLCLIAAVLQAAPATNPPAAIVVTALREARDTLSIPATVHLLVSPTLGGHARTTPDLLAFLPSVAVQKTAYGQGSPYLRGFTGFRTLCLVDGVRLNNSVFRDGPNPYWNTVDAFSLGAAELVMGPGSVLYGSDALGGVLNARSPAPPDWAGEPAFHGLLYARGASADESLVARAQAAWRPSEIIGVQAGATLKTFGDIRGGRDVGRQPHTGYDEQAFDARADFYPTPLLHMTLAHQSVNQENAWRTHRTVYGIDWKGLSRGDDKVHAYDQRRHLTRFSFEVREVAPWAERLTWTLSRHAQEEELYRVRKDDTFDEQGFAVQTWGASFQVDSPSPLGKWIWGAAYDRDVVDSHAAKFNADGTLARREIQGPVGDDASYDSLGVFLQNRVMLLDDRVELVPGARYTWAHAHAKRVRDPLTGSPVSVEDDWQAVVGSLRLLAPLARDRRVVFFAGLAQGYRAPNLSDLTRFDIARSDEIETAAPDLDPEKTLSAECGVKARRDRFAVEAAGYYTWLDDMIVRTPTGRTLDGLREVTKKNAGRGYLCGAELSGRYAFDGGWSVRAAGSVLYGEQDAYPNAPEVRERDTISRLMPPTAEIGLRREFRSGRYWCESSCQMAAKADKLSAGDKSDTQRIPPGGTPGYAVFHLRAGAQLTGRLRVQAALENLLDADYRIHGSGVNEPGRQLVLSAAWEL